LGKRRLNARRRYVMLNCDVELSLVVFIVVHCVEVYAADNVEILNLNASLDLSQKFKYNFLIIRTSGVINGELALWQKDFSLENLLCLLGLQLPNLFS
jgi:hypothetical protein